MLNTTTHGFDLAMELLCLLPQAPAVVSLRAIGADLKLRCPTAEVPELVHTLRQRGFKVRFENREGQGRCAWVPRPDWERTQREAEAYFEEVYG